MAPVYSIQSDRDQNGGIHRRMVAQQDISPGQIIVEETAYACVINSDAASLYCDCCLQVLPSEQPPLRCSACKLPHYANRDHQKRAWKQGHKQECEALKSIAPHTPPAPALLALRTVLAAHRQGELAAAALRRPPPSTNTDISNNSDNGNAGFYGILSLLSHWEDLDDAHKIKFAQLGALAWQLLSVANSEAAEGMTPREMALLVARFSCNVHTICDDELRPVGAGIYPLISMINHSCTPNAVQSFAGSKMTIRAICTISPGDEICIAYVELAATRWDRRQELLESYFFDIDAGTAQPEPDPPGGCLPCDPLISLEIHSHMPWRGDGENRDVDLTAVLFHSRDTAASLSTSEKQEQHVLENNSASPSKNKNSSSLKKVGIWGRIIPEHTGSDEETVLKSFGLSLKDDADADNEESRTQRRAASNLSKSKTLNPKVEVHYWGLQPGQLPDKQIVDFAKAYAEGLRAVRAAEEWSDSQPQPSQRVLERLQAALKTLTSNANPICLNPKHVLKMRLLAAIMKAAISQGTDASLELALSTARNLSPLYISAYPIASGIWPTLGLHYAALAKLEHYFGDLEAASKHAHSAVSILQTCFGSNRAVVTDIERVRQEAGGEFWEMNRPREDD